ncbi:GNAT family N-acetyltransferase [Epibacterium ulvae]|uniref:GNAT family N-acetyltransferase n=1 Tax=Epibacterium ulvae TaxID=1156985 RepID=UPI001BFCC909|nr:GNAT family N-acetyltransferase [Epibacterium ulvae]MBT8155584.1 GNAT family N-acetyltransferase [Epibacterium ulvae]
MKISPLPAAHAARLVPLLTDLHQLHVDHQPGRYIADPDEAALIQWIEQWLSAKNMHALVAESPMGALLGYVIYEVQHRPDLPIVKGGTTYVLHHIAITTAMRRMGIGKALVGAVRKAAEDAGARSLATTYAPFNAASAGLMKAMGLEPSVIYADMRF